uniref:Uncharacterized protein n=1 Tax=Periophthalmus magnuspinnatus TaxID=409849 RepID=A0A3B4BEK9_9GOBI
MAPVLSGVWWGPEAGVVGSGAAVASGVGVLVGSEQIVLVCTLSGLTVLLLVSVLLLLCASCQVSERDTISQSADSPATDIGVSSSHNGPLTSKEIAPTSRDVSVEDSLYETVKELKEPPLQLGIPNGTTHLTRDEPPHPPPPTNLLLNGHPSPCTPERGPLCTGVEYASVDLRKKSRHSADMEAKRRSENHVTAPVQKEEEDLPPPVPEKVLDENDNQQSAVYSTVNQSNGSINDDDKEHDYSSIAEIKGLVPASSSSDLYATVNDILPHQLHLEEDPVMDSNDPGYETIRIPKTSSSDDEHRGLMGAEGSEVTRPEPHYESVGELGLSREMSRL